MPSNLPATPGASTTGCIQAAVADNTLALIGGRNIGNQYFQLDPQSQVADDDVCVAGPVVQALSATFDEFWSSTLAVPAAALRDLATLRERRHAAARVDEIDYSGRIASGEPFASLLGGQLALNWATARVLYDTPDKKRAAAGEPGRLMVREVMSAARQVHRESLMINPYIVPTRGALEKKKPADPGRSWRASVPFVTDPEGD